MGEWFESVAEARRRARKHLPKSVYGARSVRRPDRHQGLHPQLIRPGTTQARAALGADRAWE